MAAFSTSNIQTTFAENIEALPRDGNIQHQQQSSYGSPIQTSNTHEGNPIATPEIIVVTPPPPFRFKEKRPNIASPIINMLITKAVVTKFSLFSIFASAFILGRKKRDADIHFTSDGSIDSVAKNVKNTLYKVNKTSKSKTYFKMIPL